MVIGARPAVARLAGGGVSERPKEHASKACDGASRPWVQIPPPPPYDALASSSRRRTEGPGLVEPGSFGVSGVRSERGRPTQEKLRRTAQLRSVPDGYSV